MLRTESTRVFDSAGHRVALSAQGVEKVRMVVTLGQVVATLDSHSPPDSKKLTQFIQEHLTAVGHPQKTDVPLDELVKRCLDFHEWHR